MGARSQIRSRSKDEPDDAERMHGCGRLGIGAGGEWRTAESAR
ncbi:hypothetical protein [Streptomyces canus]